MFIIIIIIILCHPSNPSNPSYTTTPSPSCSPSPTRLPPFPPPSSYKATSNPPRFPTPIRFVLSSSSLLLLYLFYIPFLLATCDLRLATCYSNSMSHPLPLPPHSHSHSHSHSGTDRPSIEVQLQAQAQAQAPPPPHLSSIPSSCVSTRVSTRTYRARSRRVVKPSQTHPPLNSIFQRWALRRTSKRASLHVHYVHRGPTRKRVCSR